MNGFCLIFMLVSSMALIAEIILRSVLKIKNFGLEKKWLCFKGKTIPVEDFLPHDITQTLIFVFSFSVFGLILEKLTMPWVIAVFCDLCFGSLVLFIKKHLVIDLYLAIKGEKLPSDRPNAGDRAKCCEAIYGGGYGRIAFEYKNREYKINALSVNETNIDVGEDVIVVHKEEKDKVCWVEKIDEEITPEENN